MSSTVLAVPASRKAQGRSASGRNGGVRKPRAPISIAMRDFALAFVATYKFVLDSAMNCYGKPQQSFSCLRAVQFCTRLTGSHAVSWRRGHFAIHVRVSSNCAYTYRSRWGRATCLSDWAQGLNMERLRAQAPWRSHIQIT